MATPINVLLCCAPEDERLRDELTKHLSLLARNELITLGHKQFDPGLDAATQQRSRTDAADVILLLLSNNLMASIDQDAMTARALERHRLGEVRLIPVILYKISWQEDKQLGGMVPLPRNGRPVGQGSRAERDEAMVEVVEGVKQVAVQLQHQRQLAPTKPRAAPATAPLPPAPSIGAPTQQSGVPASPRSAGQVPKRSSLRQFLDQVLYADERIDAFCSDEYPEVGRQFSQGMVRDAKLTRLLEYANRNELLDRIEDWDKKRAKEFWGLLKFEG